MIFVNKGKETVKLLESLKAEKDNLYAGIAFGFASKTLELIKKSVGDKSEQYRLMSTLLYDQTAARMEYTIIPADGLIVSRVKSNGQYDSIINACIDFVKAYGLYKPPSDKKNVLGDLDNSMIWTLLSLVAFGAFSFGVAFNNWQLSKYLEPNAKRDGAPKEAQNQTPADTQKVEAAKKNHSTLKRIAK